MRGEVGEPRRRAGCRAFMTWIHLASPHPASPEEEMAAGAVSAGSGDPGPAAPPLRLGTPGRLQPVARVMELGRGVLPAERAR